MKSKRTVILLILFIVVTIAAVIANTMDRSHPDSLQVLKEKHDDYKPLIVKGEVQKGVVTHRMLNGLMIHLKETPDGYEPVMGIYMNAEGAKVHVEDKNGIICVHTHSLIPSYELGQTVLHNNKALMTQIPPEHYDKGPSIFLLRFKKPVTQGSLTGEVRYEGSLVAEQQTGILLPNKRYYRFSFEKAFPDYPTGSILHISFELDGQVAEDEFAIHELPPRETVSRTFFMEEGQKPGVWVDLFLKQDLLF